MTLPVIGRGRGASTSRFAATAASISLLILLIAPAGALAWQLPAANISDAGGNATTPQVAVAPNGAAAVTWIQPDADNDDRVWVALRPVGQATFGTSQTISPDNENADKPQVAIGADGTVTVVWRNLSNYKIQTATRLAGAPNFSGVQDLSGANGTNDASVIIAPNGTATAMWDRFTGGVGTNSVIQTADRPAGQATFGSTQDVTASGADAFYPQLAADEDSNVTAVWTRDTGVGENAVQTANKTAGQASFGATQTISVPGNTSYQDVAVAPDGSAVAVWLRVNGSGTSIPQAAIRGSGQATFGAPQDLSTDGARLPQVAFAPDGQATAAWANTGGAFGLINVSTRAAGQSSFGSAQVVSVPGGQADAPQVGVAPDGTTTVTWVRQNPTTLKMVAQAATRAAGQPAFDTPVSLSQDDRNAEFEAVPVGVSANGAATAVWSWYDGSDYRIQAATNSAVTYQVTASTEGPGAVSSSPAGISCGATCAAPFVFFSSVTLTATPDPGATFTGWSGACSGTSTTCTVSMLGNRSVTASFVGPPAPDPGPSPSPGPSPGPGPGPTPAPSPEAKVAGATSSVTKSSAVITSRVEVSGTGKISQRATSGSKKLTTWCQASKTVSAAGNHTVTCNLGSKGRKALKKSSLALTLRTTFTPTSGPAVDTTRAVTIKRKR